MRTVPSLLLTVAVLAGCLAAPGCIPGVTWTPAKVSQILLR
jgi:hypothetical protein